MKSRRKISFIGASFLFVHQAVRDMLLNGHLDNTDLVLYDIDKSSLKLEVDLIKKMITQQGAGMTVKSVPSRKKALEGADYVIVSVLVGGLDQAEKENKFCLKHKIRHTVGDTIGPMSTARLLRQCNLMVDIAKDMERYCPKAWLLSPTNPMTGVVTAVSRYTKINCIGICHGTHETLSVMARAYKTSVDKVKANVLGVNHLGFIDKVVIDKKNIPIETVIKKIEKEAKLGYQDIAGHVDSYEMTMEYAKRVNFMPNNGDHHFLEFFPWFLSPLAFSPKGKSKYGLNHRLLSIASRKKRRNAMKKKLSKWAYGNQPIPDMDTYGGEFIHDIVLGLEGNNRYMTLHEHHLNIPNNGAVPNLPNEAILEISMKFKKGKLTPVKQAPLDHYRLGVLSPLIAINELAVKAAIEKDKLSFVQALMLDPLISDFSCIDTLSDELWKMNKPYFKAKK